MTIGTLKLFQIQTYIPNPHKSFAKNFLNFYFKFSNFIFHLLQNNINTCLVCVYCLVYELNCYLCAG